VHRGSAIVTVIRNIGAGVQAVTKALENIGNANERSIGVSAAFQINFTFLYFGTVLPIFHNYLL
jgi:hypothetical protein